MKKKTNKLMTALLAMVMLVSILSMGVMAADDNTGRDPEKTTGTLTLTANVTGKTSSVYTAYKVLDATYVAGQDYYDYSLTEAFENAGVSVENITSAKAGSDDYKVDSATVDSIAATLENYVKTSSSTIPAAATFDKDNMSNKKLSIGYYLILETTGTIGYKQTKPILVAIPSAAAVDNKLTYSYDVTVTIKDQPITTEKKIVDGNQLLDSISKQVGTEYTYQVVQDVPKYDDTYNKVVFKVTDKMDTGLDYVGLVSVQTKTGDTLSDPLATGAYGFTAPTNVSGATLVFDFSDNSGTGGNDYYDNVKNADQVVITYKAKLNRNATFGPSGNMNEVVPTFGPNSTTITDGTVDRTKTYAGLLEITKKDESNALLAGAEFTVYTDKDCKNPATLVTYKVDNDGYITEKINETLSATATTDKNGVVRFEGLGAGTYYIKETKAPTGYVVLKDPIEVNVEVTLPESITTGQETATFTYKVEGNGVTSASSTPTDGKFTFTVNNTKGFTLPTTGGMGTYLFVIGGVALILLAGVLFLRSRKNEK